MASQKNALAATRLGGNETDHFTLLSVKAQITHDPVLITSSWNDSLHFCQWKGVLCGRHHRRVTGLNLQSSNLTGSISPAIGNLSFLRIVNLMNNSFQGEIPPEMGVIPASFGNLSSLEFLPANMNMLEGNIPGSLGSLKSLEVLILTANQLSGSLPQTLGLTLPNIQLLAFSKNQLSGSIPRSIANASRLEFLDLQHNKFSLGVAVDFGNLKNLSKLYLSSSGLGTGDVNDLNFISTLVNCSELIELYIGNNSFGGVLPNSIANFSTQLQHLIVGGNQIFGNIPVDIGNLVSLNTLHMFTNKLIGSIPDSIGKLHKLQLVTFGRNQLSRETPSSIGNVTRLIQLWLEENNLQGNIPSSLGNCKDLSQNSLSGPLPQEVGNLRNLGILNLSHNKLSGEIPSSLGSCISLQYLYLHNNSLGGAIPQTLESLKAIEYLDIAHDNLLGVIPEFLGSFRVLRNLNLSFNDLEGEVLHQQSREAIKSFMAECRALRNTRHQTIVKIVSICASVNFQVVHCDIKPSNILLDGDMIAHVGDFGIARLLQQHGISKVSDRQTNSVGLRGGIGYVAPGKRPTNGMFKDGLNLHKLAKMALSENVTEIVDQKQLEEEEGTCKNSRTPMTMEKIHECLFLILKIGIACSEESPRDRMTIVDVSRELFLIKDKLLGRRT
ncbi:EF-TU receptor [Actinidia rufa]|uniref:EF-TU receptor n=1 Tax=Actinidia rufa TaxID=165716 RepID=A0A7J0FU53_9ERIC|nr:EF-TU receptor [Actinidia rufa]